METGIVIPENCIINKLSAENKARIREEKNGSENWNTNIYPRLSEKKKEWKEKNIEHRLVWNLIGC